MDKTVSRTTYDEHLSFFWVLNYNRFVKSDKSRYLPSQDYWGFFPLNQPQFKIRDLTLYSDEQLDSISRYYDMFFYTDAYGVYSNEWYLKGDINERSSLVYGGANYSEVTVLEKMFQQRKLIIGEFNILSSPTSSDVRKDLEDLFQIRYTGWVIRYYEELDTTKNRDIPKWMIRLHNSSQQKLWDYKGKGLVYVNEGGIVFVLKARDELLSEIPVINTKKKYTEYFKVPEYLRYPFWQDIVIPYKEENVIAYYKVHTNERGDSILNFYKVPKVYPAVVGDSAEGLRYYFCGDFSDNPFGYLTSYFKGITYLKKLFYNNQDLSDRRKFFWEYYQPMLTKIMYDYYFKKDRIDRTNPRPLPKRAVDKRPVTVIPDLKRSYEVINSQDPIIDLTPSPMPYGLRKMSALESSQRKTMSTPPSEAVSIQLEEDESYSSKSLSQPAPGESEKKVPDKGQPSVSNQKEKSHESKKIQKSESKDGSEITMKTEPRTLPTIKPPKESASEQPVESEKPFISQKEFIDRMVVLTKSGAFVRAREYFQHGNEAMSGEGNSQNRSVRATSGSSAPSTAGRSWKLIIASFTSEENAKAFAAENANFEIIKLPGTPYYRIAIKTYPTLRDAKNDIASVKESYPDAWLLRI